MKTKIMIGLIFIAVLGVCAGFFMYQKPAERIVTSRADYTVPAIRLFDEYNNNESAADARYLNKIVSVEGRISEVSAMDSKGLTIMLESGTPLFGVSCQLPEGTGNRTLKRGELVKIKGLCTGKLMDVVLVKCVLED